MRNLIDLPTDAIVLILKEVPWRDLVSSVSLVCHWLRNAVDSNEMQIHIQYCVQHYLNDFVCSDSLAVSATGSPGVYKEWYSKLRAIQSMGSQGIPLGLMDAVLSDSHPRNSNAVISFNAECLLTEGATNKIYVLRHPRNYSQSNPLRLQTTDAIFTTQYNRNQRIVQATLDPWNTDLLIILVSSPLDDSDEKLFALEKYAISAGPSQEPCTLAEWTYDADKLQRFVIISELNRVVLSKRIMMLAGELITVFNLLPDGTVSESPTLKILHCVTFAIWYHKASSPVDCGSFLSVVYLQSQIMNEEEEEEEEDDDEGMEDTDCFGIRTFNLVKNCWDEGLVFQKSDSYENMRYCFDCYKMLPNNRLQLEPHCGPRFYMHFNLSGWDCLFLEASVDPMGMVSVSEHLVSITIDPIGIISKPRQSGATSEQKQVFNFRIGRKLIMIWETQKQVMNTHKVFVVTLPKLNEQKKGTMDLVLQSDHDISGLVHQGLLDGLDLSKSLQPFCAIKFSEKIFYLNFDSVSNLKRKATVHVKPAISQKVAKRKCQDEAKPSVVKKKSNVVISSGKTGKKISTSKPNHPSSSVVAKEGLRRSERIRKLRGEN